MAEDKSVPYGHAATNEVPAPPSSSNRKEAFRSLILVSYVAQNVAIVLLMGYSLTREMSSTYLASTAVFSAEVAKMFLNIVLEIRMSSTTTTGGLKRVFDELFSKGGLKVLVPAFLYVVQNNLTYVALQHLSVPFYQVAVQGKLLTTAVCSRWLLQTEISTGQYMSLVVLALGVGIVQISGLKEATSEESTEAINNAKSQALGMFAVLALCFTSGLAGVYFERMIKQKAETGAQKVSSVYMRNAQLAGYSMFFALVPIITKDSKEILEKGFFSGYDSVVWLVVIFQATQGLLVSLVMKYADTIMKGFCTSVSIVISTLLSIWLLDAKVNRWFVVGASMVFGATRLYPKYAPLKGQKTIVESEVQTEELIPNTKKF